MKIDFGHITQIIVAIIGLIGILYSNRQQKIHQRRTIDKKEQKVKAPRRYLILFWISIALTCINLGIFGWRIFLNDSAHIEIIYPINGDQVSIYEIIKGKSKNISNDKMIWIIVYSFSSEKYFPNQNPAQIDKKGNWTSEVIIGSTADHRMRFNIYSYLIDESAKNELEKEFNKLEFAGLEKLPSNIQLHDHISVIRK